MTIRNLFDEAYVKGRHLKEEILSDMLNSRMLSEMVNNEFFAKALARVIQTKEEVTRAVRRNVQTVFHLMDVPQRHELSQLQRKLEHLEKAVDRVGKRAITIKSLRKIQTGKKAAKSARL